MASKNKKMEKAGFIVFCCVLSCNNTKQSNNTNHQPNKQPTKQSMHVVLSSDMPGRLSAV